VPTQLTGTPEFESVVEPVCWGPQGMPTAGRESTATGGAGGGEGGLVTGEGALVIKGATTSAGDGVLVGCMIVAGEDGGVLGGVVIGAGARMVGSGEAAAGAGAGPGILVTKDGAWTVGGVFRDSGVECSPITINNPTGTTTMVVSATVAASGGRCRCDVAGASSVIALGTAASADLVTAGSWGVMASVTGNLMTAGSGSLMTSLIPARGRTSVGAKAFSASMSCRAGSAWSVDAAVWVS
jgi:hypothetical protein